MAGPSWKKRRPGTPHERTCLPAASPSRLNETVAAAVRTRDDVVNPVRDAVSVGGARGTRCRRHETTNDARSSRSHHFCAGQWETGTIPVAAANDRATTTRRPPVSPLPIPMDNPDHSFLFTCCFFYRISLQVQVVSRPRKTQKLLTPSPQPEHFWSSPIGFIIIIFFAIYE